MIRKVLIAASALTLAAPFAAPLAAHEGDHADVELWRLGCGALQLSDSESFSDAHLYDGVPRELTSSCYLIRNGDRYLLWDTGLPAALVGTSMTSGVYTITVERAISDQLADLGLTPGDIDFVGVSHYHFDHVGQLPGFTGAKLLIGKGDLDALRSSDGTSGPDPKPFAHWLEENGGAVEPVAKDHDVFGDGSVVLIAAPGHTPGHRALLVRLDAMGDVLLTGDLYHFEEQVANRGVPQFNTDRADTLASMDRFDRMAAALDATVVIQHDPRHVERLPAFPQSAK